MVSLGLMAKSPSANSPSAPALKAVALLFLSAPVVAFASSASGARQMNTEWQRYIAQELQLAAGIQPEGPVASVQSLNETIRAAFEQEIRVALKIGETSSLNLNLRDDFRAEQMGSTFLRRSQGFAQSESIAPTFVQRIGETEFKAGAVFVYENFSSAGYGTSHNNFLTEGSSGSAAILGVSRRFENLNDLVVSASLQSRMSMDAYQNYRGLFSQPGRFDSPAKFTANFDYALTPDQGLSFAVDRVDYSSVAPFTSRLLPDRFVSLLGDGASPILSWRDLTVYRLGYNARIDRNTALSLDVSSSLQPAPTSDRLRRGLAPLLSDQAMSLSLAHQLSESAKLRIGASYMPFTYVLGPSLIDPSRYSESPKVEAEALLEVRF